MLSTLLDLPEFEVLKHEIEKTCISFEVKKNTTQERCPCCGFQTSKIHDHRTRRLKDLAALNKPVYLCVHIYRFRCENCREVFSQPFESFEPHHRQTIRFREQLYKLCEGTTIQDVSQKWNIPYTTLERIYYSVAQEKAAERTETLQERSKEGTVIGIDEIAVRKGHRYETVITDLLYGGIIGMGPERSKQAVTDLFTCQNILSPLHIQTVVMDMWKPFYKTVCALFPHAQIVIDKYHVVQKVTQALGQVRKDLKELRRSFKKGRYTLLKGIEKLNERQKQRLDEYHEQSPELAYAYYLKETFREFYHETNYERASRVLEEWLDSAENSPFKPFHKAANTIREWQQEILQYFKTPFTNARTEGTNHKIKNIKRRAYGYRNLQRFRLRVFLECTGKQGKMMKMVA